ncbi:mucin-2-like [Paramacrobiotus metropolitanus]|uniref:mucin-2-like n=1 Tax=Paramacrobiotus metropolitanus TaxID=2943436 RepID=UPI00244638A9|nr:mucin-2-like [Paramacrobiotus metropolitanus]
MFDIRDFFGMLPITMEKFFTYKILGIIVVVMPVVLLTTSPTVYGAKKPQTARPRQYGYCPPLYNLQCKYHCYINQTSNYTLTYQDAVDLCQSINATMPTIRSAGEQRCLERYLSGTWYSIWLGLSIAENPNSAGQHGWQWADTKVKYGGFTKWSIGEPRPSTVSDPRECAEMSAVVGQWRATDCDTFRYGVLCETPSLPFPDMTTTAAAVTESEPENPEDDETTTVTTTVTTATTTNATTTSTTVTPPTTTETSTTTAATTPANTTQISGNTTAMTSLQFTDNPNVKGNVSAMFTDAILDFITSALMFTHRKPNSTTKHNVQHSQNVSVIINNSTDFNATLTESTTTPILSLNKAVDISTVATTVSTTARAATSDGFVLPTDLPVFDTNAKPTMVTTTAAPSVSSVSQNLSPNVSPTSSSFSQLSPGSPTLSPMSPSVQCFTMDRFTLECRRGHLNISETNMELISATTAVYNGDNSFDCRTVQFNLHRWILEQLGVRERRSMNDMVRIVCSRGSFDVSDQRPGLSDTTSIEFATNLSAKCMTYFTAFIEYMIRVYRSLQDAEKKDGEQ